MKKHLSIIALVSAIFLLAGCGKSTSNIENSIIDDNKEEITNSETPTNTDVDECKQACNISHGEARENCYATCETRQKLDSKDISDCDDIEKTSKGGITRDICIQSKASEANNPDLCEKIENPMNKDACYMELANEIDDKSLCNKIEHPTIKTMCEE